MARFCDAYSKKTGRKLPDKVPEHFFDLFPKTLSKTPRQKSREQPKPEQPKPTHPKPATPDKEVK